MSDSLAKIYQVITRELKTNETAVKRSMETKLETVANETILYMVLNRAEAILTEDQLDTLRDAGLLLQQGTPTKVSFGPRKSSALGLYWSRLEAQAKTTKVSGAKVVLLENRIRTLEKELKDARDASAVDTALANLLDTIGSHYRQHKVKPAAPLTVRQRSSESFEGVAHLVLSDWHWGETVDKASVNGMNEYNIAIASRRADRIFDRSMHVLSPLQSRYDGIVLELVGDMLSGIIHEELLATNDGNIIECMFSLKAKLETMICQYAEVFPKVMVVATYGNHGRLDRRKTHKAQAQLNYETVVYRMLEESVRLRMGARCNVTFKIATASDVLLQVYDKRFLYTHGDQFDNLQGSVLDRVRAGDAAKRKRAQDMKQPVHDNLVCGHYHTYMAVGNLLVNGSLIGYNEYAYHNNMSVERPQQALYVQHPHLGFTRHSALYAEDPVLVKGTADEPFTLELAY